MARRRAAVTHMGTRPQGDRWIHPFPEHNNDHSPARQEKKEGKPGKPLVVRRRRTSERGTNERRRCECEQTAIATQRATARTKRLSSAGSAATHATGNSPTL